MKIIYTALFVKDIPSLLKQFPPYHSSIFAHHSTIAFRPTSLEGIKIGHEFVIKVLGRYHDENVDALIVENPRSVNKIPHITLSTRDGVSPVTTNTALEQADKNKIEYFNPCPEITVVEGYFDGMKDCIS